MNAKKTAEKKGDTPEKHSPPPVPKESKPEETRQANDNSKANADFNKNLPGHW